MTASPGTFRMLPIGLGHLSLLSPRRSRNRARLLSSKRRSQLGAHPELTRLFAEVRKASEALVKRLEGYEELVPARANEAAVADEIAGFARFAERQFRGWHERCRDLRELLENPELRSLPDSRPPDADPRGS